MEHTNKRYGQELSDLRAKLIQMGYFVVDQIDGAMRSLSEHDVGSARIIIDHDTNVNRMDIEIEDLCLRLLALHQPAARDLRLITAAMKITTELERVGDRAVGICEGVHNSGGHDSIVAHAEILQMGSLASAMLRDSLTAFSRADGAVARRVLQEGDRKFDRLYSQAFARLLTSTEGEPESIAHDTRLAVLSKDLNEISEHATNIAEVVMFMVDGKEIMHMDLHERCANK
jgi:phosphate transport system protein